MITLDDLRGLTALDTLIKRETERLQILRDRADTHAASFDGLPRSPGAGDRVGNTAAAVVDAQRRLERSINELERQRAEVEAWLGGIRNTRVRLGLTLHFVDGVPWMEVAEAVGGRETEYSIKHACYRYVRGQGGRADE